eukprot:gene628-8132_t
MTEELKRLTVENSTTMFSKPMNLILFTDEEEEKTILQKVSTEDSLTKEFNFFFSDYEDEIGCEIFLNFGVPTVPCLILTDGNLKKKFVLHEDITKESILNFIKKYKKNELKKFLKSAERPANDKNLEEFSNNETIIVADSFNELIKENEKEIIFILYDDSEISQKGLLPIIRKLSQYFKDEKISIEICLMNHEENDVDESYTGHLHAPSVSFISLDKKIIPYSGKGRGSELIEFIEKESIEKFEIEKLKRIFLKDELLIDEEKKCSKLISDVQLLLKYFENRNEIENSIQNLEKFLSNSSLEETQKEYQKLIKLTQNQMKKALELQEIDFQKSLKNVIEVNSIDSYNSVIKNNELVVLLFTDKKESFAEPVLKLYSKLSEQCTKFKFLKIETNENVEISLMNGINMLPTFKFLKNEKKIGEIIGGSEGELRNIFENFE